MKKVKMLLVAIGFFSVLLSAGTPIANAADIAMGEELVMYTINDPYRYPIHQGTNEWIELSCFEERAAGIVRAS